MLVDPADVSAGSAGLIAFGLVVAGVTGLAGLLLARGPWARWLLVGVVVASMVAASVGSTALTWITFLLGGLALVGLLGPWLTLWTRHAPIVEAPGPVVVGLQSTAIAAPVFVGLATVADGSSWFHWLLVAIVMASSVLYGRGSPAGRWALRTVVPVSAVAVGLATGGAGGVAIAMAGLGIGVASWTKAATAATSVVAPVLPTPVPRSGR